MNPDLDEEDLANEIIRLSRTAWSSVITRADIDNWLENFTGETPGYALADERLHALHLLRHFTYFGQAEVRVLLKSMYRDLFRYPIIQALRAGNGGTRDEGLLNGLFQDELHLTRFIGMGNPSESGSHLLYYFRQENQLHRDLFVYSHQLLTGPADDAATKFEVDGLRRVVFIDDLLGSGQQAEEYSRTVLTDLRKVAGRMSKDVQFIYLVMFAKQAGLKTARSTLFDEVVAVHELDESQNAFGSSSRVYSDPDDFSKVSDGRAISSHYGGKLFPGSPLGYRDGQMLLALHHNVPDNTLPIFWNDSIFKTWSTLFTRYAKEVPW